MVARLACVPWLAYARVLIRTRSDGCQMSASVKLKVIGGETVISVTLPDPVNELIVDRIEGPALLDLLSQALSGNEAGAIRLSRSSVSIHVSPSARDVVISTGAPVPLENSAHSHRPAALDLNREVKRG